MGLPYPESEYKSSSIRTPERVCLGCGTQLDGCTAVSRPGEDPNPGSVSICAYCGHIAIFKEDLTLRLCTEEEYHALNSRSDVQNFVRSVKLRQAMKRWESISKCK